MKQSKFFLKSFFKSDGLKVQNFDGIWNQVSKTIKPYQEEIEKNIKKMGDFDLGDFSTLDSKDIYNEYQKLWETHQTIRRIDPKKLKQYFRILFSNPNDGVPRGLYDNPEQFDDFLEALIEKNKQSCLRRLISDLLYHYPEDKILLFKRLKKVYNCLDKQKKSHQLLIEANTQFQLIEEKGPLLIAQNILDKKDLSEILSQIWLKERHLISNGIGQSIVRKLCEEAKNSIQEEDKVVLERFLKYLSGENHRERFSDSKPIACVLLVPFEKNPPTTPSIKKEITKFLDEYIGDPRSKSEEWVNMDREKSIFLKWKIGETLKDFFTLLSYTVERNPNADRMWSYRKEFIEAYWKEGHIKDAWIVLGKEAYKTRLQFLKEHCKDYGKIIKGGKPIHSVLLFKIDKLVLSEWNYNGKARIWDSHFNSPQFYKEEYSREDLVKNPKEEFIHSSSKAYYWQKKLSQYIEDYTGIPSPEDLQRKIDKFQ